MDKTKHCNLTQWELSDPIKMERFNADNVKIDSLLSKLTFFASRLALAEVDRTKQIIFPGVAITEQLNYPEIFTCSEGITVQDGTATLTGPQTGTIACGGYALFDREYSQAIVWVEHKDGEVSVSLNGVPTQPVRAFTATLNGKSHQHQELFCPALPSRNSLSVTLSLDRGTDSKMEIFNYSIILF